jgi:hypothetical protein
LHLLAMVSASRTTAQTSALACSAKGMSSGKLKNPWNSPG